MSDLSKIMPSHLAQKLWFLILSEIRHGYDCGVRLFAAKVGYHTRAAGWLRLGSDAEFVVVHPKNR